MPFLRRLVYAPLVFLAVAVVTFGVPRILRADRYPGDSLIGGIVHDLDRWLLHMDWGCSVILPGCRPCTACGRKPGPGTSGCCSAGS